MKNIEMKRIKDRTYGKINIKQNFKQKIVTKAVLGDKQKKLMFLSKIWPNKESKQEINVSTHFDNKIHNGEIKAINVYMLKKK